MLFCLATLIIWLSACVNSQSTQTGTYKYLYDYESRSIHPQYVLYHHAEDSSTVFFRVKSEELLYTRSASNQPFVSKIQINCILNSSSSHDTSTIQITDIAKEKNGWLLGDFKIPMSPDIWNILIEFTDLNRNQTQQNYLFTNKTSLNTVHNYLIRNSSTNEPIFNATIQPNQSIIIESQRNSIHNNPIWYSLLSSNTKLPPPPFSSSNPEIPQTNTSPHSLLENAGQYHLNSTENQNYFISCDSTFSEGLFIRTVSPDFPEVKDIASLQTPIRYITTKTEYEQIIKSKDPKKIIDNFWIECAGNKSRAKELLRNYYQRVEDANYYFSSYTEGWKTDRGMIHIVFGNPSKINKFNDREIWQYGDDNTPNQLIFTFIKEATPLSNNIYILRRDPAYKQYWERMVTLWRNGRVYYD